MVAWDLGCIPICHANTSDLGAVMPAHGILNATQFFARGLFATPMIAHFRGPEDGLVGQLRMYGWAARALALSALDWPLRRVTKGSTLCPEMSALCIMICELPDSDCAAHKH